MSDFNYRGKLPFRIVSSSVNTGYNAQVTSAIGQNVEIVNLHRDEYAELQDSPAQGPFTETWEGGNQHRHIKLNDGLDTAMNRPEAFVISASSGKLRIYGPDINGVDTPRATFTRDFVAKRPLNIKNILTEDGKVGNFSHNYQVVQTSGRDINESFIENDLTASGVLTTKFITGLEYYSLPEEPNKTKSVFVERFSAPGDWKESSRGALDRESEQYAPNNSLVTRNITVRQKYNSLLTQHSPQFGSGSTYNLTPLTGVIGAVSEHKVNRNSLLKALDENDANCAILTEIPSIIFTETDGYLQVEQCDDEEDMIRGYRYDNFWVQHSIPRTDLRYAWIKESLSSSTNPFLEYQNFNGGYERNGAFSDLIFNANSVVVVDGEQHLINNDAINSLVKDKKSINISTNTIAILEPSISASFSEIANSAYQYTAWKQLRNSQHPVVRKLRDSNVVSIESNVKRRDINNNVLPSRKSYQFINVIEPPLSGKFKPLIQTLGLKQITDKLTFKFTHGNAISTFASPIVTQQLGIKENSQQMYDLLKKYYSNEKRINDQQNPFTDLDSYEYRETLYPREINTYLGKTRSRLEYIIDQPGTGSDGYDIQLGTQRAFWRDDLEYRNRSTGSFINSVNDEVNTPVSGATTDNDGFSVDSNLFSPPEQLVNYEYRQKWTGEIYGDSIHSFDNNKNNLNRLISSNIVKVSSSTGNDDGNDIFLLTQQIDNGCSGELNYHTFLDYFAVRAARPIPPIPATAHIFGQKGLFGVKEFSTPSFVILEIDGSPSNVQLVQIMETLIEDPTHPEIYINYSAPLNAIYPVGGDPSEINIDITSSAPLIISDFINYINDSNNWKEDPSLGPGNIEPIFSAQLVSPSGSINTPVIWSGQQYMLGGTPASDIINLQSTETSVIDFTFLPVGNDSGNGWTVTIQSGLSNIITETGNNIFINLTCSLTVDMAEDSIFISELISFVANSANWQSGVPKFTVTSDYSSYYFPIFIGNSVFAGGTDGISTTVANNGQLIRATDHAIITQFINGDSKYGIPPFHESFSVNNLVARSEQPQVTSYILPTPKPTYVAFVGGYEIGVRQYGVTQVGEEYNFDILNNQPVSGEQDIISTLDSGLRYAVEEMSGKKPWFDSYQEYSEDIRGASQDHSILPEFRISRQLAYYIEDQAGNFRVKNKAYLDIDGGSDEGISGFNQRETGSIDAYNNQFVSSYMISDRMESLRELQEDNNKFTKLDKIKFVVSGIKKLLPYNGFYPQERTIQLANLFNDFMDQNIKGGYVRANTQLNIEDINLIPGGIQLSGTLETQFLKDTTSGISKYFSKNTIMPYFFSPGILYNTIKSGISVDFPALLMSEKNPTGSVVVSQLSSLPMKLHFETGKTINYPTREGNVSISVLGSKINNRIPFESLIFPEKFIPSKKLEPNQFVNVTGSLPFSASFNFDNILYSASIFFDQELQQARTDFYSFFENCLLDIKFDAYETPDKFTSKNFFSDQLDIGDDTLHKLGIGLRRNIPFAYFDTNVSLNPLYSMAMNNFLGEIPNFFIKDQKMNVFRSAEFGKWQNFDTNKKYYFDIKMKKSSDLVMIESYDDEYRDTNRIGSRLASKTGGVLNLETMNGRYFGWPTQMTELIPSVEEYTNPEIEPVSPIGIFADHADPAYAPFTPPYFEGEAILRFCLTPSTTSYNNILEVFDDIQLQDIFTGIDFLETGSEAYKNKMSIQDCMTIFGISENKEVQYDPNGVPLTVTDTQDPGKQFWTLYPKLETPVLDFSEQQFVAKTGSYWVSDGYGRGMWSGYGKIPTGSQGITLELAESFPQDLDFRDGRTESTLTSSLLTHIGMKPETKKIGQIAEKKEISEAIVAIPYVERSIDNVTTNIDGQNFFLIDRKMFQLQHDNVKAERPAIRVNDFGSEVEYTETSISKLIKTMRNYVIPPNFNFLRFNDIDPFVMYIFEFKQTLDQQDLADIWQGVLPKIGTTAEKETIEFGHKIGKFELFGEIEQMYPDIRWLVFKVKKKAQANYFALTENIGYDQRFLFDFANSETLKTPEYSYNWPYDYFSLVELAKVDLQLEYNHKEQQQIVATDGVLNNQFDIQAVKTAIEDQSQLYVRNRNKKPSKKRTARSTRNQKTSGKKQKSCDN